MNSVKSVPGCRVSISELRFAFNQRRSALLVIDDLTLTIEPGELVVVLGPSGCGKTTLIRILAGLWSPGIPGVSMSGDVNLDNQDPGTFASAGKLECFFQAPVLLPWLNLEANLRLPFKLSGQQAAEEEIKTALTVTQLEQFHLYYPTELSGGMQQRAVLARALLRRPSLMLMDEPFGSLDDQTREEMDFELLKFLAVWKPTVVFVTHNVREAALLGDRLVILQEQPTQVEDILQGLPRQERKENPDWSSLLNVERMCRKRLGARVGAQRRKD